MSDVAAWGRWLAGRVAETLAARRCQPSATYRIQFGGQGLSFRDACRVVPYLDALGVSHLYASPCMKVRAHSPHGYAVVDYAQLDPALGPAKDFRALVDALHGRGMGQILDLVPNHMSAAPAENRWWDDVLENGPSSPFAAYFDIDWRPVKEELHDRLLLPILGEQYGQALESGELELEYRDGAFSLRYGPQRLPIDPATYRTILTHEWEGWLGEQPDSDDVRELRSIVTALEHLPPRTATAPELSAERQREKEVVKGRLRALSQGSPAVAAWIRRKLRQFNGAPDDPHSFDSLDRLLEEQAYRLAHWKAAADEINYRRFFDVNDLAAVCMECPEVFAEAHRLVFDLLVGGDVDGLRIDHVDGMYEPAEYLRRLQRGYLLALGRDLYAQATGAARKPADLPDEPPPAWDELAEAYLPTVTEATCSDNRALPLYVVVEKILAADETLPETWLAAGTTGYDYLHAVGGLFVDPAGLAEVTKVYGRFIDQRPDFREVAHQSKLAIFRTAMSSELQLLAHRLSRISQRHRRSRDYTLNSLRIALREILACYPVYRTYIREGGVWSRDRQVVCRAAAQAKRRNPAANAAVFDFIRDVLLLERPPELDDAGRRQRELFVGRVQQVTSSVMAKGIEDTAFYRWCPLAAINEVGGDPLRAATSPDEFHRQNLARRDSWPHSLLCTSTHDTKRSEDARARIAVLAEIPHLWRRAVHRWARWNRGRHRDVFGQPAPSRHDEYLFYQTLVGVWPLERPRGKPLAELTARVVAYMEKATREAKLHTSWISPDAEYDGAVRAFIAAALCDQPGNRFLADFCDFQQRIVHWGLYGALSQTVLKLTSPGVPDVYQGQELWDFSLVDPDNRRRVDFVLRAKLLNRLRKECGRGDRGLPELARRLASDPRDPRIKLFVTWRLLQHRRRCAPLYTEGDYRPLPVLGAKAGNLIAFARRWSDPAGSQQATAIVLAPRLIARLTPPAADALQPPPPLGAAVWEDTWIDTTGLDCPALVHLFTGQVFPAPEGRLSAALCLSGFPVAVLSAYPQAAQAPQRRGSPSRFGIGVV